MAVVSSMMVLDAHIAGSRKTAPLKFNLAATPGMRKQSGTGLAYPGRELLASDRMYRFRV